MKRRIAVIAGCLLAIATAIASGPGHVAAATNPTGLAFGKSSAAEILEGAYQEILRYQKLGYEVPEEMYNFYFAYEQLVHPEYYEGRHAEQGALDEFADACPGTVINGPDFGNQTIITCGQTNNAANDCSYPHCRWGRDVVAQLVVNDYNYVIITTTGSRFDTYLCLYEDGCCGEPGSFLITTNDNNPSLCDGQRLAAGLDACLAPGTYYVVLDGAGVAARGSYCLTVQFLAEGCES